MRTKICKGRLVRRAKQKRYRYVGELPPSPQQNEPVYLLRESDVEAIIRSSETIMLQHQIPMEEQFYNIEEDLFPDEIVKTKLNLRTKAQETAKLFLDRHFYSYDIKRHLWIRYTSVDEALEEEGEIH